MSQFQYETRAHPREFIPLLQCQRRYLHEREYGTADQYHLSAEYDQQLELLRVRLMAELGVAKALDRRIAGKEADAELPAGKQVLERRFWSSNDGRKLKDLGGIPAGPLVALARSVTATVLAIMGRYDYGEHTMRQRNYGLSFPVKDPSKELVELQDGMQADQAWSWRAFNGSRVSACSGLVLGSGVEKCAVTIMTGGDAQHAWLFLGGLLHAMRTDDSRAKEHPPRRVGIIHVPLSDEIRDIQRWSNVTRTQPLRNGVLLEMRPAEDVIRDFRQLQDIRMHLLNVPPEQASALPGPWCDRCQVARCGLRRNHGGWIMEPDWENPTYDEIKENYNGNG